MRLKDGSGWALGLALLLGQVPALAEPAMEAVSARSPDSAFFITRSTNRNQVHYGVEVDEACRPRGPQPVRAYWRMLEKGESEVEPLLALERRAYGLTDDQQVESTPSGWKVHVRLRAWPDRSIHVDVFQEDGHCVTRAWTVMEGRTAQIERIFVKAAWPMGVDYVLLSGTGADGQSAREVIYP